MWRKVFFILFAVNLIIVGGNLFSQQENLIPNSGFENDENNDSIPDKWSVFPSRDNQHLVSDVFRSGKYSVKLMEVSKKENLKIKGLGCEKIPVDGNSEYIFKGYIKTSDLSEKEGLWGKGAIYYYWLDENSKFIGDARYIAVQGGTTDWKEVTAVLKPVDPQKVKAIHIVVAIYSREQPAGTVWFDDFSLVKKEEKQKSASLQLIGRIRYPHGWGVDFVKKGNYIFQTKSESSFKLSILDASDPYKMKLIKETGVGLYAARNLCNYKNYLLINLYSIIMPVDISNPKNPKEMTDYAWKPDLQWLPDVKKKSSLFTDLNVKATIYFWHALI